MRAASLAVIVSAHIAMAGCASASGEWSTALERGAAHAAAEATASESGRALPTASVTAARYDASVGLWQCRMTDGSLRYSRSECVPRPASR